jgi:hypothetical protein
LYQSAAAYHSIYITGEKGKKAKQQQQHSIKIIAAKEKASQ